MDQVLIVVTVCIVLVSAQVPLSQNGTCPDFTACRDPDIEIDASKLTGIWYLNANIPYFFQENKKCTFYNFTVNPNNNESAHIDVTEYGTLSNVKRLTTADFTYTVDGIFDSLYTDLLLPFRFTTLSITDHHWVFVSCYECDFFGRPPGIYVQVLTKVSHPECDVQEYALASLDKCDIPRDQIITQNQNDCDLTCDG